MGFAALKRTLRKLEFGELIDSVLVGKNSDGEPKWGGEVDSPI